MTSMKIYCSDIQYNRQKPVQIFNGSYPKLQALTLAENIFSFTQPRNTFTGLAEKIL